MTAAAAETTTGKEVLAALLGLGLLSAATVALIGSVGLLAWIAGL